MCAEFKYAIIFPILSENEIIAILKIHFYIELSGKIFYDKDKFLRHVVWETNNKTCVKFWFNWLNDHASVETLLL